MKIDTYQTATALWLRYEADVVNYLRHKGLNQIQVEELSHTVLMKTINACCRNRAIDYPRAWLLRIAHNALVDGQRRQRRKCTEVALPDATVAGDCEVYRDLSCFVGPVLNFLPERYAYPLRLADLEGLPQVAVAARLGLSLSATKSRIQRGRKLLRQEFATCFHLDEGGAAGIDGFTLRSSCQPLQELVKEFPEKFASF